jgi:hypothetical protein
MSLIDIITKKKKRIRTHEKVKQGKRERTTQNVKTSSGHS